MVVWVSPYPSEPETYYPLDYLVLYRVLVGRPVVSLDTPRGIRYVVVEIVHGEESGQMRIFWVLDAYRLEHPPVQSQDVVTLEL